MTIREWPKIVIFLVILHGNQALAILSKVIEEKVFFRFNLFYFILIKSKANPLLVQPKNIKSIKMLNLMTHK